jgi:hypothetical protein
VRRDHAPELIVLDPLHDAAVISVHNEPRRPQVIGEEAIGSAQITATWFSSTTEERQQRGTPQWPAVTQELQTCRPVW